MNKNLNLLKSITFFVITVFLLYSIFLNVKYKEYIMVQKLIQSNTFTDNKIPDLMAYEKWAKKGVSYYNFTVCELKSDLEKINRYGFKNVEALKLDSNKKYLSNILHNKKEILIEYLNNKKGIECNLLFDDKKSKSITNKWIKDPDNSNHWTIHK